jgi:uncharacterized protein (DUF427 family)
VLLPSETSSYCPYKGEAGYFSVHVAFYTGRAEVLTLEV